MKNADNAAAVVKKNGKDHWRLFSEEMRAELYENVMLTTQLHRAVREKEFLLHYQPQVDAATGRVKGFEALIRWQSPELGFVSPARFIPLAERNGLIHAIGQWVLAEACGGLPLCDASGRTGLWEAAGIGKCIGAAVLTGRFSGFGTSDHHRFRGIGEAD